MKMQLQQGMNIHSSGGKWVKREKHHCVTMSDEAKVDVMWSLFIWIFYNEHSKVENIL